MIGAPDPVVDLLTEEGRNGRRTASQNRQISLQQMRTATQEAQFVALSAAGYAPEIEAGAVSPAWRSEGSTVRLQPGLDVVDGEVPGRVVRNLPDESSILAVDNRLAVAHPSDPLGVRFHTDSR